ncbi:hypothetical protein LJC49_05205 [Ruminococcaceae bacterium OttesenSCG-928-I18]|nr:hypothetical protein [Ruminococcaceae bacterium OttesenSCG-928-I18]
MTISEYFEKQYYVQQGGTPKAETATAAGAAAGENAGSFYSALLSQVPPVGETAGAQMQQNAETQPGGQTADPAAALAAQERIGRMDEAELTLLGTHGLSEPAAQKQTELLARLDRLCADYPGVHYRLSDGIFQKMADDPAFEKSVYEAVDAFEKAARYATSLSSRAETSMHLGPDGEWLMHALLENDTGARDAFAYFSDAAAEKVRSAEDLQKLFPHLSDELSKTLWESWLAEGGEELRGVVEGRFDEAPAAEKLQKLA